MLMEIMELLQKYLQRQFFNSMLKSLITKKLRGKMFVEIVLFFDNYVPILQNLYNWYFNFYIMN